MARALRPENRRDGASLDQDPEPYKAFSNRKDGCINIKVVLKP
jgi:hypothetical protein